MARHATLNLTGQTFGRLQVIARASPGWWKCVCECGSQTTVRQLSLRSGNTKSCGCLRKEMRKHIGGPNPENLERRFVSLREQGLSIHAIGKLTGRSHQTVINYLKAMRLYKSFKARTSDKFRDQILALRKRQLTCATIAQQLGISEDTVKRVLKRQGAFKPLRAKPRDLTGERYGRLVVVKTLNARRCICVCDCGKRKNVNKRALRFGYIKSCGCLRREHAWTLHLRRKRVASV